MLLFDVFAVEAVVEVADLFAKLLHLPLKDQIQTLLMLPCVVELEEVDPFRGQVPFFMGGKALLEES